MKKTKKYKAMLFDYDGTIMDTNQLIESSWQHMANLVLGRDLEEEEYIHTYGIPLHKCMDDFAKKHKTKESGAELAAIYRAYQRQHDSEDISLFEGIREALDALRVKGIKPGIVTSRLKDSTVTGLARFGLNDYFEALVSADDTDIHKPNPEPALLCCEMLGVDPRDAIMVGDSVYDLLCGKNAGCASCFVEWSVCATAEEAVRRASPDFIVKHPVHLVEIVG